MNKRLLAIIAASLVGVSFILYAVANGVPSWAKAEGSDFTIGLWQYCGPVSLGSGTICIGLPCTSSEAPDQCKRIVAGRAFMTIACILSPIAAILLILLIVGIKMNNRMVLISIKALPTLCLVMGILGVALGGSGTIVVFAASVKLGPAAIIGFIAVILNLVGAIAQSSLFSTQELLFLDVKFELLSSFICKRVIKKYQIFFREKSVDQRIRFFCRVMSNHESTDDNQTVVNRKRYRF